MATATTRVLVRVSAVIGVLACGGVFVAGMLSEPPRNAGQVERDEFQQAMDDAIKATRAGRLDEAIALSERALELRPGSPDALYQLSAAVHASGDYERALGLHERVARTRRHQLNGLYNKACALALLGRSDDAIAALRDAYDAGYFNAAWAMNDPDLVSLHDDARFVHLLTQMRVGDAALLHFWVGEWDCYSASSDSRAGSNTLAFAANGKAIVESWEAGDGTTGGSWNYFHPTEGVWKQFWVDGGGGVTEFVGKRQGGGVLFEGTSSSNPDQLVRMFVRPVSATWVRQTGTFSDDAGQTWKPRYDLMYVPKGETYPPDEQTRAAPVEADEPASDS